MTNADQAVQEQPTLLSDERHSIPAARGGSGLSGASLGFPHHMPRVLDFTMDTKGCHNNYCGSEQDEHSEYLMMRLWDASSNNDTDAVLQLLDKGVKPNWIYPDDVGLLGKGACALHWAVQWANVEMAKTLLAAGADPTIPRQDPNVDYDDLALRELDSGRGFTPLHDAADLGDPEMVKLLLFSRPNHGAIAANQLSASGKTPFEVALDGDPATCGELAVDGHLECAKILLAVLERSTNRSSLASHGVHEDGNDWYTSLQVYRTDINTEHILKMRQSRVDWFKRAKLWGPLEILADANMPEVARILIKTRPDLLKGSAMISNAARLSACSQKKSLSARYGADGDEFFHSLKLKWIRSGRAAFGGFSCMVASTALLCSKAAEVRRRLPRLPPEVWTLIMQYI